MSRLGGERRIDRRDLRDDGNASELRSRARQDEREIDRPTQSDSDVRLGNGRIAYSARGYLVIAQGEKRRREYAVVARFYRSRVIRLGISDRDERAHRPAARVSSDAANEPGGCLRLRKKNRRSE